LAEDKSKGVYIKLDTYGWGGDDERDSRGSDHGRGDRKGGRFDKGGRGDRDGRGDRGRRGERGDRKPRGDRSDKREFDKSLEGLSFEERMEVYKKKYSEKSGAPRGDKRGKFDKNKKRYDKRDRFDKKGGAKGAQKSAPKKTLENRGIVGFFKSLFGKKK